ncbi:hypothetical protein [Frankia sp. R82]|uniref:hypothetical protein n=1 Tax=Frankia sp. R82 TaxID=2950553 RepID=UPI0020430A02|nr:hypothetical protein [Frankia sp. R82]MCM3883589.1 hypothetical protein [Frankia sp. R82]
MPYAVSSRLRRRPDQPAAGGAPQDPVDLDAPGQGFRAQPRPEAEAAGSFARGRARSGPRPAGSRRRVRSVLAATGTALTLTGLVAVGGAAPAQAGGATWAECPSGQVISITAPPEPGQPSSGMTRLAAGFYAHIAQAWPPATSLLCRTERGGGAQVGQPPIRIERMSCPNGQVTFGVPRPQLPGGNGVDGPPVRWGTYLPDGWYDLSATANDPGWTPVCWSQTNRTATGPAAGSGVAAAAPIHTS